MAAIWQFIINIFDFAAHISCYILFVSSLILMPGNLCRLISSMKSEPGTLERGKTIGLIVRLLGRLVFVFVLGFVMWKIDGETISNWFLPSSGMFGKEIGGYEKSFLDKQYPPKREDGKLVDCWEWHYRKEDGRYIVPIEVPKPYYFSEYNLHLLPMSKRSFLISGNLFWATKQNYEEVKSLLISKYGMPVEEQGYTCTFIDGKKKICLVFTDVLGKPQLYINAYRDDLLKKNLPAEIRMRKDELRRMKEKQRHDAMDSL